MLYNFIRIDHVIYKASDDRRYLLYARKIPELKTIKWQEEGNYHVISTSYHFILWNVILGIEMIRVENLGHSQIEESFMEFSHIIHET